MKTFGEYIESLDHYDRKRALENVTNDFFYDRDKFDRIMRDEEVELESDKSRAEFIRFMKLAEYFSAGNNVKNWLEDLEMGWASWD